MYVKHVKLQASQRTHPAQLRLLSALAGDPQSTTVQESRAPAKQSYNGVCKNSSEFKYQNRERGTDTQPKTSNFKHRLESRAKPLVGLAIFNQRGHLSVYMDEGHREYEDGHYLNKVNTLGSNLLNRKDERIIANSDDAYLRRFKISNTNAVCYADNHHFQDQSERQAQGDLHASATQIKRQNKAGHNLLAALGNTTISLNKPHNCCSSTGIAALRHASTCASYKNDLTRKESSGDNWLSGLSPLVNRNSLNSGGYTLFGNYANIQQSGDSRNPNLAAKSKSISTDESRVTNYGVLALKTQLDSNKDSKLVDLKPKLNLLEALEQGGRFSKSANKEIDQAIKLSPDLYEDAIVERPDFYLDVKSTYLLKQQKLTSQRKHSGKTNQAEQFDAFLKDFQKTLIRKTKNDIKSHRKGNVFDHLAEWRDVDLHDSSITVEVFDRAAIGAMMAIVRKNALTD